MVKVEEIKMAKSNKLERMQEVVYFGDHGIVVTEQPHKATKQFLKYIAKVAYDGYNIEIGGEGFTNLIEALFTEKPFEALKIFIPELTEEIYEDASNRELIHIFKKVMLLNGLDIDKIVKNVKPLLEQVNTISKK